MSARKEAPDGANPRRLIHPLPLFHGDSEAVIPWPLGPAAELPNEPRAGLDVTTYFASYASIAAVFLDNLFRRNPKMTAEGCRNFAEILGTVWDSIVTGRELYSRWKLPILRARGCNPFQLDGYPWESAHAAALAVAGEIACEAWRVAEPDLCFIPGLPTPRMNRTAIAENVRRIFQHFQPKARETNGGAIDTGIKQEFAGADKEIGDGQMANQKTGPVAALEAACKAFLNANSETKIDEPVDRVCHAWQGMARLAPLAGAPADLVKAVTPHPLPLPASVEMGLTLVDGKGYRELAGAVSELIAWCNAPNGKPNAEPNESPPPRVLAVNVERRAVTLDGQSFDVRSNIAIRWLKVLSDHPGEWLAAGDLKKFDPDLDGARPDRLKRFLPAAVLELIESETGKGSRLRLP